MKTMRGIGYTLVTACILLAISGCGGAAGSGSGTAPSGSLAIVGLPTTVSNAATVAVLVAPGASAVSVTWLIDRGDGAGPTIAGSGATADIAVPEGELTITVRVVYADGSARSASAGLVVDRTAPVVTVQGIQVEGVTSAAADVEVKSVADADGLLDTAFRAGFTCDGTGGAASLPADAAGAIDWDLPITVDGTVHSLRITELSL